MAVEQPRLTLGPSDPLGTPFAHPLEEQQGQFLWAWQWLSLLSSLLKQRTIVTPIYGARLRPVLVVSRFEKPLETRCWLLGSGDSEMIENQAGSSPSQSHSCFFGLMSASFTETIYLFTLHFSKAKLGKIRKSLSCYSPGLQVSLLVGNKICYFNF